jgi:two-component system, OmpR family, response regulator
MMPSTLALIDDDPAYAEHLSQYLRQQGIQVDVYSDSNLLLGQADPYRYGFYIVDLLLPGVDGVNLIKLLRQRSRAGILVVSGWSAATVFKQIIDAGADMHLNKPVPFEQVALAILAVQRRAAAAAEPAFAQAWVLHRAERRLTTPQGAVVDLSEGDLVLLECFAEAAGEPVSQALLRQRMTLALEAEWPGAVSAAIHRLRRRIERATRLIAPLQARSGLGYVFRAPLVLD